MEVGVVVGGDGPRERPLAVVRGEGGVAADVPRPLHGEHEHAAEDRRAVRQAAGAVRAERLDLVRVGHGCTPRGALARAEGERAEEVHGLAGVLDRPGELGPQRHEEDLPQPRRVLQRVGALPA